jgi:hypothetical protein
MTAPAGVFVEAALPDAPDRAMSVLTLIRALYATSGPPPREVRALRNAVGHAAMASSDGDGVALPLPLPRDVFESLMRQPLAGPESFFGALLRDRRASLLYYGAMSMDAATREFLAAHPDVVRAVTESHAGIVAAFGRSLHVANNRVLVPGGDEAVPLWEEIVGARVTEPGSFVRQLFVSREGRLAYMFDAIAHLDDAHQRFTLGLWIPDAASRLDRLRAVQRAFTDVDREWSFAASPFGRPRHDAVLLLRLVSVDSRGAPAQPSSRAFWNAAFASEDLPEEPHHEFRGTHRGAAIDAAALVDQILLTPPPVRKTRFDTYAFGVRRFATVDAATAPDAIVALRAFARYPAVMLGLERMGVATAAVYAAMARACERVAQVNDPRRGHIALAQFQGPLAVISRAARAGRIDSQQVEALVTSFAQVDLRNERYEGRVATWIENSLLPLLTAARPSDPGSRSAASGLPFESIVLTAMADRSRDADGRTIEWEGLSYAIDVTAGDLARFQQVRARHGSERLDDVLNAARELRTRGNAAGARDVDDIDRRLADVLIAIVYAPHQGDPAELFPAAAALYRRHDFGLDRAGITLEARRRAPWERPRIADTAGQTRVHGSLLGLDLALARFSVRRLIGDRMPAPPTLNQNDREAVFETATLLNPDRVTDAQMHAIAAALARGQERIAAQRSNPAALDRLAREAGVSETRRNVISWMVSRDSGAIADVFTLAELMRAGSDVADAAAAPYDAWGTTNEPLAGCYCLAFPDRAAWENFSGRPGAGQIAARLPDLALRLAELLTGIGVPAALMPATFAYAAQDFVDEAPARHTDDGGALVQQARALTRLRVEDYLAAVAARGPLRPIQRP